MSPRSLCLLVLLTPGVALAAIDGAVSSTSGRAIVGARVEGADGEVAFTAEDGSFSLAETEPPVQLMVSHPRFAVLTVAVAVENGVEIRLSPKQEIYEEIVVSASRGQDSFTPLGIAASLVEPDATSVPVSTLTELVREVPGVAENGPGRAVPGVLHPRRLPPAGHDARRRHANRRPSAAPGCRRRSSIRC